MGVSFQCPCSDSSAWPLWLLRGPVLLEVENMQQAEPHRLFQLVGMHSWVSSLDQTSFSLCQHGAAPSSRFASPERCSPLCLYASAVLVLVARLLVIVLRRASCSV